MVTPMTSTQASPGIGAYYTPAQGAVTANPMYLPGANLGTPSMSLAPQPPSDVMVRSVATAPVGTTEGSIVVKDLFTEDFDEPQLRAEKLQFIEALLNKFSAKYGPATAREEIVYVPLEDQSFDKFSERKAFNLVIER